MASVASLHNRRVFSGDIDWLAIAAVYDRLIIQRPTAGIAVARAAAHRRCSARRVG
jgi:predicted RNA polymerase sigma factor